jgi:MFS family permease
MPTRLLLAGLFFLSGLSALAYQVVWQRVLTQEIGVDSISIAFIVAIFLLGIGAGSYSHRFIAHLSLREKRNAYIFIEIAIALFGIFSIHLLRTANQAAFWGDSLGGQFVLNMLILLAPTLFMGLTTPLILDLVKAREENIGRTIGLFYGVNILGAAIGAMITGLALIEIFGLRGVAMLCASINFVLALGVGLTLRDIDGPGIIRPTVRLSGKQWGYLLVAVFFGFGAMALQMAYYRTAYNHFQLYTFIFPFMLGVFLLAMAVGQFVFGQIADRVNNRSLVIAVSIFIFSLVLLIIYRVPMDFFQPCQYEDYPRLFIRFAAIFMVPVAIASGMFTLLTRYTTSQAANAGYQFGLMMAAVSLGNVLGALIGPLFLFTLIGTMGVLSLAIALYTIGVLIMYESFYRYVFNICFA